MADFEQNSKDEHDIFCIKGKRIPSLFLIGIQKCGTSTLDAILSNLTGISHGSKKEHHFFDHENHAAEKYIEQFPNCDDGDIVRTYDATPNYTNPCSKSAERLKIFYHH